MTPLLNRRRFLQALAGSVVAAGAPLPIGFPEPSIIGVDMGGLDLLSIGQREYNLRRSQMIAFALSPRTAADLCAPMTDDERRRIIEACRDDDDEQIDWSEDAPLVHARHVEVLRIEFKG